MTNDADTGVWVRVIKDDAVRLGALSQVFPKGLPILLTRDEAGAIHAFANKCPHMGCPLARGKMEGNILKCPCHDWRFDVTTGVFLEAPEISLQRYEWKLADGYIHIKAVP